jgi:hypothetical protein
MPVCAQTVCALVMSPKAGPKNGQGSSGESLLIRTPSNGKPIGQGVWRAIPHPFCQTSRTTRPVFPASIARRESGRGKDETHAKFGAREVGDNALNLLTI